MKMLYNDIGMQRIENITDPTVLFVFDLEFIGDVRKLNTCYIWEIAVYCTATQQWFELVVDPDPSLKIFPPPPIPEIPQLTREFLEKSGAVTWDIAFKQFAAWVDVQRHGALPIFISHNTFRADKPILELECRRYSLHMPLFYYFFDSLHFSRRVIRNTNGNYSLSGLHQQIFNKPIENAHRARNDVMACISILQNLTACAWALQGPIYPSYCTALRTVRWIGQRAEELLFESNIRSVESLYLVIMERARRLDHQTIPLADIISQTLESLMRNKLPRENIRNIAMQLASPERCLYCHTFMEPLVLRCGSPNLK